eukprot:gene21166-28062_t
MVSPPKMLHSVEVHNTAAAAVSITVTFNDEIKDKKEITETAEIAAGGSHLFDVKTLDMGSYQAVAPVKSISHSHENNACALEPAVDGVVKVMKDVVAPQLSNLSDF